MAKKTNPFVSFMVGTLALGVGVVGGAFAVNHFNMPTTEELIVGEESFYSYNNEDVEVIKLSNSTDEMSIHFLEVGNKYTGDCTYIKVGDIDILIDCGSKANSVSTVSNYLNQYMGDDNVLDYVIVTHAHQDHYAGFATTTKVSSIFDLYDCPNIITFSNTNQKTSTYTNNGITSYAPASKTDSKLYNNFNRELNDELNMNPNNKHLTVVDIIEDDVNYPNNTIVLNETLNIGIQFLDQKYYYEEAGSENDYSVCTMFNYGERYFLLTGDLEEDGEESLVESNNIFTTLKNNNKPYGVEVYKAGHHGSKTSSSAVLLEHIRPDKVCVCCCAGSPEYTSTINNQFPTQDFISRVGIYTENIFVTTMCVDYDNDIYESMNGNIVIVVTLEAVGIDCTNNNTKLKDTEWFANNRTWPTTN